MTNTYTNHIYHIVFSTKNRLPLITPDLKEKLYNYIGGIIQEEKGVLISIGGMPDHIHICVKLKACVSISEMLRKIKSNSSKWVNELLKNNPKFAWQNGFGSFTVSESQLIPLMNYIKNQEEHHRNKSFKDEFIGFVKKQNIKYDEKYFWK
ncbi:transposase [bacterium K02(2017)]|nr:transposase [bacterium K02(2017)]